MRGTEGFMLLENKIAIVTGGTRGIGFSIVKKYLENGATVILCGSKPETAAAAVEKLKAIDSSYKVEGIAPNLSDYDDVAAKFKAVKEKYGRIDILVNNAGVSDSKPFLS
jgi:3-oxoacyl-[acyl-carrier protein] reductase/7-alpha-hydroxysteroid dehydrogenase